MKDAVIFIVTLAVGIAAGILFAKPAEHELAALEALARGEANKALFVYRKLKSKVSSKF